MAQLKRRHRGLKDGPRRKILSMLFGNNSGGDPASLLASAPLRLDALGYSVIPTVGAVTPTFTRATTKTVVDSWGRMVTCLAGEVAFPGARRVRNLLTFTEDFTNAAWTLINGGTGSAPTKTPNYAKAPDGTTTACRVVADRGAGNTASDYSGMRIALAYSGTQYSMLRSVYVKSNTASSQVFVVSLNSAATTVTATTEWTWVSDLEVSNNGNFDIGTYGGTGAQQSLDLLVWHPQTEDVTGQSVQTAGDYVSVGAVQRNVLLYSNDFSNANWTKAGVGTGVAPVITPNTIGNPLTGYVNASTCVLNRGAGNTLGDSSTLSCTVSTSAGTYTGSVYVKGTAGEQIAFRNVGLSGYTVLTFDGTWQRLTSTEVRAGNGFDIASRGTITTTNSVTFYIYGAQLEVGSSATAYQDVGGTYVFHGSCVDGVKCFPTDLSGNPLTGMTTPLIELAATNLAFKSNEFTTAPWAMIVSPSITKNAIGVDGATSAWTVTVSQGDEYNQLAGIPLTAATYTRSIKIKKTTGAQSAYPVILVNSTTTHVAAATIDTTNGTGTIWTAYSGWTITTSSVRVTSWNADFWLVELTFLATATNWAIGYIGAMTTNVTKSSGSFADADVTGAAGTHVMQHLQLELGSKATSYIDNPNAAASVTRNADQLYYTGALIGNLKSIAVRGLKRDAGFSNAGWCVALSDGTINNYESVSLPSATQTRFLGVSGGVTQWDVIPAYTAGQLSNAAWSAAANDIKVAKDGVAQTQDTSATVPTVSRLEYGMVAGAFQLNGYPGKVYGWTRNLSQSELNSVTV